MDEINFFDMNKMKTIVQTTTTYTIFSLLEINRFIFNYSCRALILNHSLGPSNNWIIVVDDIFVICIICIIDVLVLLDLPVLLIKPFFFIHDFWRYAQGGLMLSRHGKRVFISNLKSFTKLVGFLSTYLC